MTDDPLYQRLREISWRRKLSAEETAALVGWLAEHPEAQADWQAEASLNQALERLPQVPVPSNFTARVLQALEREEAAAQRRAPARRALWSWRLPWLRPTALAALFVGSSLISYHELREARRQQMLHSVEVVSQVASMPSPEILQDFDAIRAMSPTPPADEQLLALLQ